MVKKLTILLLFMGVLLQVQAQPSCYAKIELDNRNIYVQQPFKVTFTVLTATWYTEPLDFQDLQMPNAFIIPFSRTIPGMFDVNGKQYAGLQFYYIVFPYKPGTYTIPPIKIIATTPPKGSSESRKITIATQPAKFVVKPIPNNYKGEWMVAKDVAITERWSRSLRNLKVGDVIERTVTENAKGTLPQFIPELKADTMNGASVYPQDASLKDTRDDNDANGMRTQTFTYLLEKEGDLVLPAMAVKWWNPYRHRTYQRHTRSIKIHVAANPNLGILATLKDSLAATKPLATVEEEKSKGPYLIYGIPWYWFTLYALAALFVLYLLVKIISSIYKAIHRRRQQYKSSEIYWFRKFEHSSLQFPELLKRLYAWWDRFAIPGKSSSIIVDAKQREEENIAAPLSSLYKEVYEENNTAATADGALKKSIKLYREELQHNKTSGADGSIDVHQKPWD